MEPRPRTSRCRPPKQQRSREAWNRVLDAGVAILEDGGYEAFTIAAVCERAGSHRRPSTPAPTSKDALFLAVYEHGIAGCAAEQRVFADATAGPGSRLPSSSAARWRRLVGISLRHQPFLRAVVLISAAHAEVRRRGSRYSRAARRRVRAVVLPAADAIAHADPGARGPRLLRHGLRRDDHPGRLRAGFATPSPWTTTSSSPTWGRWRCATCSATRCADRSYTSSRSIAAASARDRILPAADARGGTSGRSRWRARGGRRRRGPAPAGPGRRPSPASRPPVSRGRGRPGRCPCPAAGAGSRDRGATGRLDRDRVRRGVGQFGRNE